MKLIYPAIFMKEEDGEGYTIEFPDLPGCITEGDNMQEALAMAVDAASGWVLDELENGKPAPEARPIESIVCESEDDTVVLVVLDTDSYAVKERMRGY